MNRIFWTAAVTALTLLTAPAAETPGVVCENGICRLEETGENSPAPELRLTVLRRAEGYQDAGELRRFLRGETAETGSVFRGRGILWTLLLAFFAGVLLNFTPCVLPLIPIHLALITAGDPAHPRHRALCYGGGMAAGCTVTGVLFITAGLPLGFLSGSPWFNLATGALLLVLALAVLGIWQLDFSRWRRTAPAWHTAGPLLTFGTGALMAVLSGACVAPVLLAALLLAAELARQGELAAWLIPALLGLGMGSFWPLAAGHAVRLSGKFGRPVKILLALLTAGAGIYYAVLGIRLLRPAERPAADLTAAAAAARAEGKPLLIRIGAVWCRECRRMESGPWRDPEVRKLAAEKYIAVEIQADAPEYAGLLRQWQIHGVPAIIIGRCEPPETE